VSLTLRVRPVHLALCALLFLSSLLPALGVVAAYVHAASSGPTAPTVTPAASPRITTSPLSPTATTNPLSPTATPTANVSRSPILPVTAAPTASASALPTPTGSLSPTTPVTGTATTGDTSLTGITATPSPTLPVSQSAGTGATAATPARPHAAMIAAATTDCPSGWACADIGSPALVGGQSLQNGVWSVAGAGADIWNTTDQFHYVWQPLVGNGHVGARIVTQTPTTSAYAKAGLMLRQSTDPAAAYYFAGVTPSNLIVVQYRSAAGATAQQQLQISGAPPAYLQVTRTGATLTTSTSTDGVTWTPLAGSSVTIDALAGPLLGGLAVTSHNTGALATATFDTVTVGALAWDTGVTTLPAALSRPAVTVGADGALYVVGGGTSGAVTATTWLYDPRNGVWAREADLPVAREGAQAVTLPDGRIAVLGGGSGCGDNLCSGGTVYNQVDVYTPSANAWATLAPMHSARYRFAAVLYQGVIYAIGGSTGVTVTNTVETYNAATNAWTTLPPSQSLPHALEALVATVDGHGHIAVLGGYDGTSSGPVSTLSLYDGTSWSSGPTLPQGTLDAGATLGADGQIYLAGGYNGGWLTTVQVYNPTSGAWSTGPVLPYAVAGAGLVTARSGQIYLMGGAAGATGGGVTAQVAVYGPRVTMTPDGGPPGSVATLHGQDFAPGDHVTLTWGGSGGLAAGAAVADLSGAVSLSVTIPLTAARGMNTLTAQDLGASYAVTTGVVGEELTWTSGAMLPQALTRPAVAVGVDGRVYAFGGATAGGPGSPASTTTSIYHPTSDSWSQGHPLPTAREGAQAVTLPDGRILVLGGGSGCADNICTTGTVVNTVEAYDLLTNVWTTLAPMLSPRYRFAAVLYQGLIYAIGGSTGVTVTNTVETYNAATNAWTTLPPSQSLPQPVEALGVVVDPKNSLTVVAVGGFDGNMSGLDAYNAVYTYKNGAWSTGPPLPTPREDLGVVGGPDGRIYAIGGYRGLGVTGWVSTVEAYDTVSGQWWTEPSLPARLCCMGLALLPSGEIVAIGGADGATGGRPTAQVSIGTLTTALGNSARPMQQRRAGNDGLSANVDLFDGYVDVSASGLSVPARGPDLALNHTWDSQRAQNGDATAAGQGWNTDLSPSMGGVLTQTVSFTDTSGTRWLFPYFGNTGGNGPFSQYDIPPGAAVGPGDLTHHRLHPQQYPDRRGDGLRRTGALADRYRRLRQPECVDGGDDHAHARDQQRRPVAGFHLQRRRAARRRAEPVVAAGRGRSSGQSACRVRLQRQQPAHEPDARGGHV